MNIVIKYFHRCFTLSGDPKQCFKFSKQTTTYEFLLSTTNYDIKKREPIRFSYAILTGASGGNRTPDLLITKQ